MAALKQMKDAICWVAKHNRPEDKDVAITIVERLLSDLENDKYYLEDYKQKDD